MTYTTIGKLGGREIGRVVFTPTKSAPGRGTLRVTGDETFLRRLDRAFDAGGERTLANVTFHAPLQRNRWDHVQAAIGAVSKAYGYAIEWSFEGVPKAAKADPRDDQ